MTDVFISYKREEREKVVLIADRLRTLGLDVWFDAKLTTGHHFDREIDNHVRRARCVIVCWSEGALGSEWVRAEAAIGRERGVLVPSLIEQCSPPVPFNTLQTENLIGWIGEADHEGWLKIVARIGELMGRPGLVDEQRNRAETERAMLRTKALLEAQLREEEEAQRRAADARNRRAALEAQLSELGTAVERPEQSRRAYEPVEAATSTVASYYIPDAAQYDILDFVSDVVLGALALGAMYVAWHIAGVGVLASGFAFVGASLGVVSAGVLKLRRERRRPESGVRYWMLAFVLVHVAIGVTAAVVSGISGAAINVGGGYSTYAWSRLSHLVEYRGAWDDAVVPLVTISYAVAFMLMTAAPLRGSIAPSVPAPSPPSLWGWVPAIALIIGFVVLTGYIHQSLPMA